MLRLAKLSDSLATNGNSCGDMEAEVEGSAGGGRGREELAALAVKQYLRGMAVG